MACCLSKHSHRNRTICKTSRPMLRIPRWLVSSLLTIILQLNRSLAHDPQVAGEFTAYHYPTAKQVSGSRSPGGWWVHCLPLSYSWTGLCLKIPRWLVSSLLTIIIQLNRYLSHDPQVAGEFIAYHYPTAEQVSGSRSPGGWWVHCLPLSYSWTGLWLTIPRWLVSSLLTIILQLNRSLAHDPQVAGEFTAYHYPTAKQVSVSRSPGGWWVHCLPLSYS